MKHLYTSSILALFLLAPLAVLAQSPGECDPFDIFTGVCKELFSEEIDVVEGTAKEVVDPYIPDDIFDIFPTVNENKAETVVACLAVYTLREQICKYEEDLKELACKWTENQLEIKKRFVLGSYNVEVGTRVDLSWLEKKYPEIIGGSCYIEAVR